MLQGILSFEFLSLTGNAWFTIGVVLALFVAMIFSKARIDVIFLTAMSSLLIAGVVDTKSAFGGLTSDSVLVVAVLFIVVEGLTYTGVLNWIVKHLMGTPKTLSGAVVRVMFPAALMSSVMSNTTVVALFINVVRIWSRKLGITPSKLLIPLSYAAGMGGICTIIGTPANLVVSGLYADKLGENLGIFTTTLCGLFCLVIGVVSVVALKKLLPERKSPVYDSETSELVLELTVPSDHPYIGLTLQEIYDRSQNGTDSDKSSTLAIRRFDSIIAIKRYDNEVETAGPETFLMGADHIIISGLPQNLKRICQKLHLKSDYLEGYLKNEAENAVVGKKTIVSTAILIGMILLSAFKVVPLLVACILAAIAMVLCKCCTSEQAMKSINWEIVMVFAGSFCIGKALESTGVALKIAQGLLDVCGSNPYVVLTVICLVATFITEFISNTAAAAMFFPIAIGAANALGVNPLTFAVALMIAASSSFATPIGSPTHMLVYGPGGYKFTDFAKIGIPMNFIILAANVFITTKVFPF